MLELIPQKEDICRNDQVSVPNLCYYYSGQFGSKCIWVDFNVSVLGFNLEGMTTRTCIKSRKPFLFRFRRWEILKRQNYAKNGLPKFATRHSAQTGKFRKPNA